MYPCGADQRCWTGADCRTNMRWRNSLVVLHAGVAKALQGEPLYRAVSFPPPHLIVLFPLPPLLCRRGQESARRGAEAGQGGRGGGAQGRAHDSAVRDGGTHGSLGAAGAPLAAANHHAHAIKQALVLDHHAPWGRVLGAVP